MCNISKDGLFWIITHYIYLTSNISLSVNVRLFTGLFGEYQQVPGQVWTVKQSWRGKDILLTFNRHNSNWVKIHNWLDTDIVFTWYRHTSYLAEAQSWLAKYNAKSGIGTDIVPPWYIHSPDLAHENLDLVQK